MSHDRHQDPATSETSHPAADPSSIRFQLADSAPWAEAQTCDGETLSAYTAEHPPQYDPWSAYAVNPLAPISAYNSIPEDVIVSNGSFIQRDSASLVEPPDAPGDASLQGWNTLEPYQNQWPDNVSMGEISYLGIEGENEGFTSPAMQHSYLEPLAMRDVPESWMTPCRSPVSGVDTTFARIREDTCVPREAVPLSDSGLVAFQYRLDRAEESTEYCIEQPSYYRIEEPTPSDSSTWYFASKSPSDVELRCSSEGCSTRFSGDHKRGNLARHTRLKHNTHGPVYRCETSACQKSFRRTDARRKHYRKHHPELAGGFPVSRRSDSRVGCRKENVDRSDETRSAEYGVSATTGFSVTTPIVPAADELHYTEEASSPAVTLLSGALPQKSHENGESVQCYICQKTFGRAAELRRHNMSFHDSNTPEFYCEVPGCPRGIEPFARKDKLRDHIDKMHAPPTTTEASEADEEDMQIIYSCPEDGCDKVFDHKAGLLRHQRTHTAKSERKHKCSQCDESFLYPKDLKRHEATHLNDGDKNKPAFYCEVVSCEYGPGSQGFSRKDALLRHIKKLHPDQVVDKKDTSAC